MEVVNLQTEINLSIIEMSQIYKWTFLGEPWIPVYDLEHIMNQWQTKMLLNKLANMRSRYEKIFILEMSQKYSWTFLGERWIPIHDLDYIMNELQPNVSLTFYKLYLKIKIWSRFD